MEKLGIKADSRIIIMNPPQNYSITLGALPEKVSVRKNLAGPLNFIHCFVRKKTDLESKFPALKKALSPNGTLWISWPKGSSKLETDLNENIIRQIGLDAGLVDVKVCAVDEIWSGLKFVYRTRDRS